MHVLEQAQIHFFILALQMCFFWNISLNEYISATQYSLGMCGGKMVILYRHGAFNKLV